MLVDLRQNDDLEQLMARSKTDPILIFKHSTQCPISGQAYEDFIEFTKTVPDLVYGVVLVIENRNLSNSIAERFGVRHQSPQVLLIKDGRSLWHASHWSINSDALSDALKSYGQPAHQRN